MEKLDFEKELIDMLEKQIYRVEGVYPKDVEEYFILKGMKDAYKDILAKIEMIGGLNV